MAIKVFVDFDGTISKRDVGKAFFRKFGGPGCDEIVEQYRAGSLSAVECFRAEADAVGVFDRSEAERFICEQEIDATFVDFVAFCASRNIEIRILSDGLDYYIRQILDVNEIRGVQVFANHAEIIEDGGSVRLSLAFPYTDAECSRCACCKRNLILTYAGDDDIIVYVGEGYSDRCPARYADVIFAKAELQSFCQSENISYHLYETFGDVQARLGTLLAGKRQRKRLAAEHLRRDAFIRE
ncbi:MAG: MtnX-like HAD-IB family phosphatase [Bacteroidota bacterium]